MFKKKRAVLLMIVTALAVAVLSTGCQILKKDTDEETETEAVTEAQTQKTTETETESEEETESETELQTNISYTSKDGTVRIVLPDSTWKVTQDADEMRVFSSGSDAMINIVHAEDKEDVENTSLMTSEDDLEESLTQQYPEDESEEDSFKILSYETHSSSAVSTYEYVVQYTYSTSMWSYSVTYGLLTSDEDEAYVVTGTITDDNKDLLDAVQESVESFTVLNNSAFSNMPDENESESETDEDEVGAAELATLTTYNNSSTRYASTIVNVRQSPSTEADIIGSLSSGDSVEVIGETPNWYQVSINGTIGYVSKEFLVSTQEEAEESEESEAPSSSSVASGELASEVDYGTSYTYYTSSDVNMRAEPSTDASVVGGLGSGAAVTVIGETPNWYLVSVNGTTGYVSKAYVSASYDQTDYSDTTTYDDTTYNDNENYEDYGYDDGTTATGGSGVISGTVTYVGQDTLTLQADDGSVYTVDYSGANVSTSDGLYDGLYVSASVDYDSATGTGGVYATDVTGY